MDSLCYLFTTVVFVVEKRVHGDEAKVGLLAVYLLTPLQTYSFTSGQYRYRKYPNTVANITVVNVIIYQLLHIQKMFYDRVGGLNLRGKN